MSSAQQIFFEKYVLRAAHLQSGNQTLLPRNVVRERKETKMEKTKMDQALEAYIAVQSARIDEGDPELPLATEDKVALAEKQLDRAVAEAARSDEDIPAGWAAWPGSDELRSLVSRKRDKIGFAQQVRDRLLATGLSEKAVSALMRAAGPGAAERALQWAVDILENTNLSPDGLTLLLADAPFGVERHIAALELADVPYPPVAGRQTADGPSAADFARLRAGVLALQRCDFWPAVKAARSRG